MRASGKTKSTKKRDRHEERAERRKEETIQKACEVESCRSCMTMNYSKK
jgi:hypothetical protein